MPEPSLQEFFDDEGDIDFPKVVEIIHTNLRNFLNAVLEESFTLAADENYRVQVSEVGNKLCDQSLDAYLDRAHIVSSEFYVELETGFYKTNTSISKQKDYDHSAIQTIDTDLIELTVTADQLVNRSVQRHSEIIERLALQLEELSIHSHQDFNCRCLHPEEFYNIFLNSITPLNLPVDGKILILKLMYQVVSPNLNDFYQSMNEFLLNLEIDGESVSGNLASTDTTQDDNEVEEKESSSLLSMTTGQFFAPVEQELWNQEYDDAYGTDNEANPSSDEELNDSYGPGQAGLDETTVSVLLQPYQPGTQSNSSAAQRRQFVRALSSVQKIEAATNAVFKATQIKTAVQRTLQEKGALDAVEIVENEDKVIDFVSKIFEVILDDDSLCDAIKALLAKLQISTIKLALVDFTFFQNSKHPARQLLNKLTSIGLSVNGKEEALFKRLKDIINLITDNFETDVQVFSLALKEIIKIESHPELITQPSNYTHKLKSQRSAAKRVVIHTIKKITKGRSIPNQVLEFCLKCWAPHMAYIYMNKGRSSQEWRNSVRTLRRVTEVSQGIHTYKEILEYISSPDQFFNHIRQDLDQFSNHSDDFSDALEEAEVWYLTYLSKVTQEAEALDESEDEHIDQHQDAEELPEQQDNVIHLFSNLSPDDKSTKENDAVESPQEAIQDLENEDEAQATDSIIEESNPSSANNQTIIEELEPDSNVVEESAEDLNIAEHLPASIVPGVWMEIYQGEDKAKRRLKFSNSDRENNILFFTDRSGDYRFEIDLITFLDDLSAGRSSLINEGNRFDLALSSVINNIRSNQDGS